MSFVDVRFPVDISYGSSGGPAYSTDIVVNQGGYEQRNANWAQSRARYNVAHGVKSHAQLSALIAFFRARQGRAHSFRFKDWADFAAVDQVIGQGDDAKTQFQLVKSYESGGVIEDRIITKPVAGTLTLKMNAVAVSTGEYEVEWNTGVVLLDVAPAVGANISASFEFDVPVRFDTDQLAATLDSYGANSWRDIPLVEIRE